MLRKDTTQLLHRIKTHNMRGMLTTNGTLFNRQSLQQLIDDQWDEVHFSVDGADAATHDRLRGQQGVFKKTIRAACLLSVMRRRAQLPKPLIALHFVITNQNYQQLSGMIDLAQAVGAYRVDFDALIAYRPEQEVLQLSPHQQTELVALAQEAQAAAKQANITTTLANFMAIDSGVRGKNLPKSGTQTGLAGAPCLKAWHHLVIQANGASSPCCVLAGQGGSAATQPLQTVWLQDQFMQTVRQQMAKHRPLNRCRECSANILKNEVVIRQHLARHS